VAKPALGRGLGNLLGNTQIATKPELTPVGPADASPVEVDAGLGNLLRAGRTAEVAQPELVLEPALEPTPEAALEAAPVTVPSEARHIPADNNPVSIYKPPQPPTPLAPEPVAEPAPTPTAAPIIPRWALVCADVLLMAMASLLVFKSPAPLKAWEMAICVSAVVLGALLACAAVMNSDNRN
jgi:hypothetical protein